MAKFSKMVMGKEVGDADVYAEPHKMNGKVLKISDNPGKDGSMSSAETMRMSVGDFNSRKNAPTTKTTGIKMRGTGCATKGVMSRGPMA
jgi:hypothetical protein